MSLSGLKVFDTAIKEKAHVMRDSKGEFFIVGGCFFSRSAAKRYVDYVLFDEATSGSFSIQCVQVK